MPSDKDLCWIVWRLASLCYWRGFQHEGSHSISYDSWLCWDAGDHLNGSATSANVLLGNSISVNPWCQLRCTPTVVMCKLTCNSDLVAITCRLEHGLCLLIPLIS